MDGAIDIWDSGPQGYFIQKEEEERAKGRDYWIHNGGRPWDGAIVIYASATDAQATSWGRFKHDIRVWFAGTATTGVTTRKGSAANSALKDPPRGDGRR